jgi:hypothetical protein
MLLSSLQNTKSCYNALLFPSVSLRNQTQTPLWVWRCTPRIPVLGRLQEKDCKFQNNLGCMAKQCLKKKKKGRKKPKFIIRISFSFFLEFSFQFLWQRETLEKVFINYQFFKLIFMDLTGDQTGSSPGC